MKVIMIKPFCSAVIEEIDGSLEGMQRIVGGLIELYCPFENESVGIIINEEGKLMGLPQNRAVVIHDKVADILCGPAFICGLGEDGEFTDLTEAQISRLIPRITMLAIQC